MRSKLVILQGVWVQVLRLACMLASQHTVGLCSYELKPFTFGIHTVRLLCSESATSKFTDAVFSPSLLVHPKSNNCFPYNTT